MAWDQKKWYAEKGKLYAREYYKKNKERICERARSRLEDIATRRRQHWLIARARSAKQGVPFSIEVEDINWVEECPILKIPLVYGGSKWNSPSLDKVNPELGYVLGNVRVISTLANSMKAHATKEQLLTFSENIVGYMEGLDK